MAWTGATPTILTQAGSTSNASSYATASVTLTAGNLYLVAVVNDGTAPVADPTSVQTTGGAVAFSKVGSKGFNTGASSSQKVSWWWVVAGSTVTATITISAASSTGCAWTVIEITSGFDTGTTIVGSGSSNSVDSATTVTLTPAAVASASNLLVAAWGVGLNSTADAASGTNWTSLGTGASFNTPTTAIETAYNTGGSSTQITGSGAGTGARGIMAIEVAAAPPVVFVPNGPFVNGMMMALALASFPAPNPAQSAAPVAAIIAGSTLPPPGTDIVPAPQRIIPIADQSGIWRGEYWLVQQTASRIEPNYASQPPTTGPLPGDDGTVPTLTTIRSWPTDWTPSQSAAPVAPLALVYGQQPPKNGPLTGSDDVANTTALAQWPPAWTPAASAGPVAPLVPIPPVVNNPPPASRYGQAIPQWQSPWTAAQSVAAFAAVAPAPPPAVNNPPPASRYGQAIPQWQVPWTGAQSAAPIAAALTVPPVVVTSYPFGPGVAVPVISSNDMWRQDVTFVPQPNRIVVNNPPPSTAVDAPPPRSSYGQAIPQWQVSWDAQRAPKAIPIKGGDQPPPASKYASALAQWQTPWTPAQSVAPFAAVAPAPPPSVNNPPPSNSYGQAIPQWQASWTAAQSADPVAALVPVAAAPPFVPLGPGYAQAVSQWSTDWRAQTMADVAAIVPPPAVVNNPPSRTNYGQAVSQWGGWTPAQSAAPIAAALTVAPPNTSLVPTGRGVVVPVITDGSVWRGSTTLVPQPSRVVVNNPPAPPRSDVPPLRTIQTAIVATMGAWIDDPTTLIPLPEIAAVISVGGDQPPRIEQQATLGVILQSWVPPYQAEQSEPSVAPLVPPPVTPVNNPPPRRPYPHGAIDAWQVSWTAQAASDTAPLTLVYGQQPPVSAHLSAAEWTAILSWPTDWQAQRSAVVAPLIPRVASVVPPSNEYPYGTVDQWQVTWRAQRAAPVAPLTLAYGQQPPVIGSRSPLAISITPDWWSAQSASNAAAIAPPPTPSVILVAPYPIYRIVAQWPTDWQAQRSPQVAPQTLVYGQQPPVRAPLPRELAALIGQQWPELWTPAQRVAPISITIVPVVMKGSASASPVFSGLIAIVNPVTNAMEIVPIFGGLVQIKPPEE